MDSNLQNQNQNQAAAQKAAAKQEKLEQLNRLLPPRLPFPMDLGDYKKWQVKFPCVIQPKMDGCFMRITRMGWRIYITSSGNHMKKFGMWASFELAAENIVPDGYIIEGEFYGYHAWDRDGVNVTPVPFNKLTSAFLTRMDPNSGCGSDPTFVLYAFDMIPLNPLEPIQPYYKRYNMLREHVHQKKPKDKTILLMPSVRCNTREELDEWYTKLIKRGYEGAVVRNMHGMYESGARSTGVMKWKPLYDYEYELVDYVVGEKCLKTTCRDPLRNLTFGATWYMSQNDIEKYVRNKTKYIGRCVTVKFNMRSERGVPRAGIVKGLRWEVSSDSDVAEATEGTEGSDTTEGEEER